MENPATTKDHSLPKHEVAPVLPHQPQSQNQTPSTAPAAAPIETLNLESNLHTEPIYPKGTEFWFTILALCLILVLGGLDANIVATAVPSITDHFHTVADVGWYSSAFRLCTCAFQFGFAKLYQLFSIKRVFLMSVVIYLVGSLLCATAASSLMFVTGRAVTGLGFAGNLAGCFAVAVQILPLDKRPMYVGLMACVESLAIVAAPIVGGALTQSLGWRWCFWINLPIGAVSLAAMVFLLTDPPTRREDNLTLAQKIGALDLISNCLFIPSLTALFIALSWAGTKYPWSDGKVIGLFVVFGVLLIAFFFNQYRRGDSAALPFRVIKRRNVIAGFIYTTCTNSMTNVLEWYLPTYYQVVQSRTPGESGYLMIPILVGMMLGLFIHGIGTSTFGYYTPFMIFGSICMPIAAGLMTTYNPHLSLAQIIFYSGFAGFSGGIGFQGSQTAVQATLSAVDVNLASGSSCSGRAWGRRCLLLLRRLAVLAVMHFVYASAMYKAIVNPILSTYFDIEADLITEDLPGTFEDLTEEVTCWARYTNTVKCHGGVSCQVSLSSVASRQKSSEWKFTMSYDGESLVNTPAVVPGRMILSSSTTRSLRALSPEIHLGLVLV